MTVTKSVFILIYLPTLLVLVGCNHKNVEKTNTGYPISSIDIKNVKLTDSFWLPKVKLIQEITIKHSFEKCAEEGRMDNFLIAGKKMEGKTRGAMPFDDTDLYKTIEGASYSLVSLPNPNLDAYLDSIISIIKIGQEPDGYITTWFSIDRTSPPAKWVKPSKERWENEISSHELYNSGHLFEAAVAHYWTTGKRNFLDIAIRNADLLVKNFGRTGLQKPPGHQIVETGLIKLYQITDNKDYLKLAKFYLDIRGDSTTHKLYGVYNQDHLPVVDQADAVGHAVRAEYMYAAMTDIAAIYKDTSYLRALNTIWDNVVERKTYITGGIGARHQGESFGDDFELPNLTAYNETCAAIGSVSWNQKMFLLTGDVKYYDVIERTLYNGLISGISTDGKTFFYPNPLESDGEYKFNQGSCTRQSWFDCSCCPTNLIRFIPSIPGLIYAQNTEQLYVNLFASSNVTVKIKDQSVNIVQQTGYPWNGDINFLINPESKATFTLKIRIPGWMRNEPLPGRLYNYVKDQSGSPALTINGNKEEFNISDGYLSISRQWQRGDSVQLNFPMPVRQVIASNNVKDNANKVAFEVGPIVYCAEEIDNPSISTTTIMQDLSLKVEKEDLMNTSVNVLTASTKTDKLKLIPYYLWSNRGVGKMKVWLPYTADQKQKL